MSFDYSQEVIKDYEKLLESADEEYNVVIYAAGEEYLTKHQHQFLQQNLTEILETVYQHEAFTDLWNYCLEEISPLLELLLKRDDLSLYEIFIWDSLVKWCFSQHSSIQKDVKKWNKEEIVIMERTLHRFTPLIRFYHIPSADFIAKVYPFKKIMPEDLIDNILVFHMTPDNQLNLKIQPPRKPKCIYDSIIINKKHFAIFSSWIEKKNQFHYTEKNIPYNFNLIYRVSMDDNTVNTVAAFHTKCDNKGATIVIVKITNSEQIVGGYNPLYCNSRNAWESTYDSLLFSFTDKNNLQSAKVSYSNGNQYSIRNYPSVSPAFGGSIDLFFKNDVYSNSIKNGSASSYPAIGIPVRFKADDFEVFQIVKNN
ncbi:hypothetical protein C1646_758366 [Rhizophagus diaphanus]|nr:hypothetical protein C1646_758366 [Rhizophagus diaphanus] [Rhizophagus sp. MUCL 43196]